MSDTTAQSHSVEGTASENVEVTPSQTEETPTPTPEQPTSEETPTTGEEPSASEDPVLSDEEVEAIVAEMLKDMPSGQVIRPTFPEKSEDVKDDVEALKVVVDQVAEATLQAEQEKSKREEVEAKVTELTTFVDTVKSAYGNVTTFLGTEVADKLAEGKYDEVPAHLNPENWKKVAEHPFFGPQVEKLLKGETVDLPQLIKEAIGKRQPLPDITETAAADTPSTPAQTPKSNLIRSMRAMHGL